MPSGRPLTPEEIASVYREVLGRTPSSEEIDAQLATRPTLDAMLRLALDSEEYAQRLEQRDDSSPGPAIVNVFHPDLAHFGFQPGTHSPDGIAIVGRDGWLFLRGAPTPTLVSMSGPCRWNQAGWRSGRACCAAETRNWTRSASHRRCSWCPTSSRSTSSITPEDLSRVGPRPVERLLGAPGPPIFYPLERLRAASKAGEGVYLRTDTHLTFRGNEMLFHSVAAALGVERPPDFSFLRCAPIRPPATSASSSSRRLSASSRSPNSLHHACIVRGRRVEIATVEGRSGGLAECLETSRQRTDGPQSSSATHSASAPPTTRVPHRSCPGLRRGSFHLGSIGLGSGLCPPSRCRGGPDPGRRALRRPRTPVERRSFRSGRGDAAP